jgi:predicted HD phosphohydrolase
METVEFIHMVDGTREDYLLLERLEKVYTAGVADRVLRHLLELKASFGGYQIDRLEHSLQCATRAYHDGASEELVVAALLHDIGDLLAPHNHGEIAAAMLQPYVSDETYWIVKHHGVFQAYYYAHHLGGDRHARDAFRGHPHFTATVNFCHRWDQPAFDPDYPTLPLSVFEPMVRRVFAREPLAHQER